MQTFIKSLFSGRRLRMALLVLGSLTPLLLILLLFLFPNDRALFLANILFWLVFGSGVLFSARWFYTRAYECFFEVKRDGEYIFLGICFSLFGSLALLLFGWMTYTTFF